MHLRTVLFAIACSLLFIGSQRTALAQSGHKRSDKMLAKAKEAEKSRNPWGAIVYYKQAVEKFDGNQEAWFRMGLMYRMYLNDMDSMQWAYENLLSLENIDPKFEAAYYYLSDILYRKGKYDQAKSLLDTFIGTAKPKGKTAQQANSLMGDLMFSMEHRIPEEKKAPFRILEIPSAPKQIYFPELTPDKSMMVFTAMNGNQEDIFVTEPMGENQWSVPFSISDNINTPENEGACSISADGRTLIFTACNKRGGYGSCDLYISYKEGGAWSRPDNLGPAINSSAWESQPALSADGRTLYFTSNRKGGMGGRDLYVSYFKDGAWSRAENLGRAINTAGDEISPFIFADGKSLFFGSNAYSSFGGFDIYYTKLEKDWRTPVNIGNHINDHHDQISIFISSDRQDVFYSSEMRKGQERISNIYHTDMRALPGIKLEQNGFIKGVVTDADNGKARKAEIQLYDIKGDTLLYTVQSDAVSGEYLIVIPYEGQFAFYADAEGYMLKSNTFEIKEQTENFRLDIALDPIKQGSKLALEHIYFDFDSFELRDDSFTEIKRLSVFLQNNPDIKVEIAGYTDYRGSAAYNLELSAKRANAVREALVKTGIEPKRLQSKGYGATEGEESARRVEMHVL